MTFIVSPKGVRNTEGTEVRMGKSKVKIGGKLENEGKMELNETDLEIGKDLINRGDFRVNNPHYFAQAVLELVRTTKDISRIGLGVLKILSKS